MKNSSEISSRGLVGLDAYNLHNQLERVDDARLSTVFHDQLKRFCNSYLKLLDTLISDWTAQLSSVNNDTYVKHVSDLKSNLTEFRSADLQKDSVLSTYDAMKKVFDDVFFDVDRFTLEQAKKSRAKVDAFDQLLDELAQRPV